MGCLGRGEESGGRDHSVRGACPVNFKASENLVPRASVTSGGDGPPSRSRQRRGNSEYEAN